jgi:S1-C subfamily serine protease
MNPDRTTTPGRLRRLSTGAAAAGLALPLVVGAVPASAATLRPVAGLGSPYGTPYESFGGYGGHGAHGTPLDGNDPSYGADVSAAAGLDTTEATAAQSAGVVLVSSTVDFGAGETAGTGLVLDSSGIVVTNHHVVEGATDVEVTDAATGETYAAQVLGTDATHDVAVLRLADARDLTAVTTDTAATALGAAVTAVGDAGGDGGSLTAATGTITDLHHSITVADESGTGSSRLRDVVEVDADIIPGDSGGALLDVDGDVIGMNVAASSGSTGASGITGYVIPVARVLRIADAVLAGDGGGSVELGTDGFLGVGLASGTRTAVVAGAVPGTPAADAGITAGDTVTAVDGAAVTSATRLRRLIAGHRAGDDVRVGWTDAAGGTHRATLTLVQAPVA